MKFLIFQHARVEHPGIFREFFAADGIEWHAVELDEGEPIPSLDGFDALMAFGGPMDVWQENAHPWLVAEKAAIRSWVCERRKPYLGICLGHQLLADALGGTVRKMDVPEIGVCEVTLNSAGASALLFRDLPLVIEIIGGRHGGHAAVKSHHQAIRVPIRQRFEQNGVHHAEYGGVRPDSEGQDQNSQGGEPGVLDQRPQGVA